MRKMRSRGKWKVYKVIPQLKEARSRGYRSDISNSKRIVSNEITGRGEQKKTVYGNVEQGNSGQKWS